MNEFIGSVWNERVCDECGKKFSFSCTKKDYAYKYISKSKAKVYYFDCYTCYNKFLTRLENKLRKKYNCIDFC